jgi:hypothetical protein
MCRRAERDGAETSRMKPYDAGDNRNNNTGESRTGDKRECDAAKKK